MGTPLAKAPRGGSLHGRRGSEARGEARPAAAGPERWQLPESIAACLQPDLDYDNNDRTSLVNAVVFANALAKKCGVCVGRFDATDVDAIVMIGRSLIGVNDDVLRTLTKTLKDRVTLFD